MILWTAEDDLREQHTLGLENDLENSRDGNIWKSLCGVHQAMLDYPQQADIIFDFCTNRHDKRATALTRTFLDHGIDLPDQTITRHRNRICACHKRMPERYDTSL